MLSHELRGLLVVAKLEQYEPVPVEQGYVDVDGVRDAGHRPVVVGVQDAGAQAPA
jgi:hypothetical protein